MDLEDPFELVQVGPVVIRIIRKEVLLADRVVGFKHWKHTAYGAQAIEMILAFGSELDQTLLRKRLRLEAAEDALEALQALARSSELVDEQRLQDLLDQLPTARRKLADSGESDQ